MEYNISNVTFNVFLLLRKGDESQLLLWAALNLKESPLSQNKSSSALESDFLDRVTIKWLPAISYPLYFCNAELASLEVENLTNLQCNEMIS